MAVERTAAELRKLIEGAKRLSYYDDVAEWEKQLAELEAKDEV